MTFNKRSLFAYRTFRYCEGYFIRKSKWLNILANEDLGDLVPTFKKKIRDDYIKNLRNVLLEAKEFEFRKISNRADVDTVLSV